MKRNKEMAAQHSQQEEVTESWKPSYISNAEFSQLMLEALDGFLIAISKSGQVIYCSGVVLFHLILIKNFEAKDFFSVCI